MLPVGLALRLPGEAEAGQGVCGAQNCVLCLVLCTVLNCTVSTVCSHHCVVWCIAHTGGA